MEQCEINDEHPNRENRHWKIFSGSQRLPSRLDQDFLARPRYPTLERNHGDKEAHELAAMD